MIMFPTLCKDTVNIGIDAKGSWVEVDMLPTKDFDKFRSIQEKIHLIPDDAPKEFRVQEVKAAREEMLAMAKKVMPKELHSRIDVFDYIRLSALITVLCTGDDNSEKDDPKKKVTLPSQMRKTQKQKQS